MCFNLFKVFWKEGWWTVSLVSTKSTSVPLASQIVVVYVCLFFFWLICLYLVVGACFPCVLPPGYVLWRQCSSENTERMLPRACQCVPKQGADAAGAWAHKKMKKKDCLCNPDATHKETVFSLSLSMSSSLPLHWSRQHSPSWGRGAGSARLSPTMASSSDRKTRVPLLLGSWCPRN